MKTYQLVGFGLSALALAACGGGGSSGSGGGDTGGGSQPTTYTVSTNVTGGGSLSPSSQQVNSGDTTTLTVSANENHELASISGCGGSMTDDTTYTTGSITSNCTVSATFDSLTFTVGTSINEGATINPASVELLPGEHAEFLLSADEWYSIEDISGCPIAETIDEGDNNFTIVTEPLDEACDLDITMSLPGEDTTFEVTTSTNNNGGSFDPESATVSFDEQAQFTLTINDDYRLLGVEGCSGELNGNIYTTAPIRGNCNVHAEFEATDGVYFEDDVLAAAVRSELGIAEGEAIEQEQLAQLSSLDVRDLGISSLVGLEQATGLRQLNLSGNDPLVSIEPLYGLELTHLNVSFTSVASIGPVTGMPLRELDVWDTDIESIDAVSTLSELEYLDLDQTNVLTLEPVRGLQNLSALYLNGTLVRDLRPILDTGMGSGGAVQALQACASSGHRVTARVIETLEERGATVFSSLQTQEDCALHAPTADIQLNSDITDGQVNIDWNVATTASADDLVCELHIDLDEQQPRVPFQVLEDCDFQGQLNFEAEKVAYRITMLFDDGLGMREFRTNDRDRSQFDLNEPNFHSMDWGQVMLKTNPLLVPGREALLRAHIVGYSTVTPPDVVASFTIDGVTEEIELQKPNSLIMSKSHRSLTSPYTAIIPEELMQPGLEISIFMDGELVYTNEPTFSEDSKLYITVVPMVINGAEPNIPADNELKGILKQHWAFSEVQIRRRSSYTVQNQSSIEGAGDLLRQLADLRASEGGTSHYHGFFEYDEIGEGPAGVAFVGGTSGVSFTRPRDVLDTFSHEMGHNFSIGHINCGSPEGVEQGYPYTSNSIGSVGISVDLDELYEPHDYRDIMSYCNPQHISDWVYERAQDFMQVNPSQPFSSGSASEMAARSLPTGTRISGVIDPIRGSRIESLQPFYARSAEPGSSEYVLTATDVNGNVHTAKVAIHPDSINQSGHSGYFTSVVPAAELKRIKITRNKVVVLEQEF